MQGRRVGAPAGARPSGLPPTIRCQGGWHAGCDAAGHGHHRPAPRRRLPPALDPPGAPVRAPPGREELVVTAIHLVVGVLAVLLLGYLVVALLAPEKLQ